ncbi:MAG TPA: hypothetical protein VI589_16585 [Vicinamibacteria bacterium]
MAGVLLRTLEVALEPIASALHTAPHVALLLAGFVALSLGRHAKRRG